jgi:histidine triad (HIT) family protein
LCAGWAIKIKVDLFSALADIKKKKVMKPNCIFCKIIAKQLPSKVIAETQDVIVIDNIFPKTPIHYLIIPKKHIADINALTPEDTMLVGEMVLIAKKLSEDLPAGSQHFRLAVNNGSGAGQSVFHLHFHFLAGKTFLEDVHV